MFLKAIEVLNKSKPLAVPYKGVVVDNQDPLKLGRVKCTIDGIFAAVDDIGLLPWIAPHSPTSLGGRSDSSSFMVPELESELVIEFPYESIYAGFYTGFWQSQVTHHGMFNEDYPETYGFSDKQNTFWKVNKRKKYMELSHSSGSYIRFDSTGDIEISSKRNVVFASSDGKTRQSFDMNGGVVSQTPKEESILGGNRTKILSKECVTEVGEESVKVSGGSTRSVGGGSSHKVGGSHNFSVLNNLNYSIGGNCNRMVVQKTTDTFGAGYKSTVASGEYFVDIILGNYKAAVKAGNIDLGTLLGSVKIGNPLASVQCSPTGAVVVDAKLTAEVKALVTATLQGVVSAEVKGALVKLGAGTAPIVTIMSDPIEDFVSGKPKLGVPTIMAG